MKSYLREQHRSLPAYVPGTHDESDGVLRLNTNESPYRPSVEVLEAVAREIPRLNYYNDPDCTELRAAISRKEGVELDNVLAGNGSDQVLQLAFLAFAGPDCPIYLPDITYSYYDLFAALYQIPLHRIPLREDFTLCPADYSNAGGMIVFPNPNAPTGLALTRAEVAGILEANPDHVVLVDEAYVDFGGETVVPLIETYPNLLVVRTFSKSGSLAGLRLGYGIGCKQLIADLAKVRNAVDLYGVNRMAQASGVAICENWKYYEDNCRRIMDTRDLTAYALCEMGFTVLPSRGNFLFARPAGISAADLQGKLAERDIFVRHFSGPRTEDWLRITIGTAEDMAIFVDACKDILGAE
ncbi:MAG: histidinol-phosphate transaminase [Clostridia bacterium]|nr:histidinol-phosphate transaminase [Clostridia bacterium]